MSKGLGSQQLAVLTILANHEATITEDKPGLEIMEIAHDFRNPQKESAAARSSIRRALATMWAIGLVDYRYYPHRQGQPRIWRITDAGLEVLQRRGTRLVSRCLPLPGMLVSGVSDMR